MFYCENCMLLCSDNICPNCKTQNLRDPKENDPVYLVTKRALWSGGIEDALKENGIPCLKRGIQGAGITERIGYTTETYEFFVPFGAYEKSKNIVDEFFITE